MITSGGATFISDVILTYMKIVIPSPGKRTEEKKKCGSVGERKREDAKRLIVPITSC